jgi:hypothetical protein
MTRIRAGTEAVVIGDSHSNPSPPEEAKQPSSMTLEDLHPTDVGMALYDGADDESEDSMLEHWGPTPPLSPVTLPARSSAEAANQNISAYKSWRYSTGQHSNDSPFSPKDGTVHNLRDLDIPAEGYPASSMRDPASMETIKECTRVFFNVLIPGHGEEAMRAILQASVGDSISRSAALIAHSTTSTPVRVVSLAILADSLHWKEANHADCRK